MSEYDLDRAIDTAARQLITREPSRELTHAVMARVREDAKPSPLRLMWLAAPASVLLCAAIAVAILNRSPQSLPAVAAPPVLSIAQPLTFVEPQLTLAHHVAPSGRNRSAASSRTTASNRAALPRDVSTMAPIEAQPIAVAAIEVPRLAVESTLVEPLIIEPLTIEPLMTSND